jgi:predicted metallopeptidase
VNRFNNRTIETKINDAIAKANELLHPCSKMMDELRSKNDWKFNSGSGEEVFKKILDCKLVAPVFFYRPFNPFTSALGYSDGVAIHLNSRKFNMLQFNSLVGLLCHEYLHIGPKFSHGNNYKTKEKCEKSVNYFVSENVSRWL